MNVYKLEAAIGLNSTEYQKGLKAAGESMSAMGDKIKAGAAAIGKATAAGLAAGAAAVGKIVSDSVAAYGEYEQLVGGVETLFGDSAQTVLANSEKAFATAGMSMSEYTETSIQSAAALINSLEGDQARAADLMDMSIIDMSDNVNKMGTTMEAVQNAYRGFSRGNFTMLDNLSLGFSGTKEGMQELLDKAEQLSGIKYDISSYSDIVQAIHVVQQEMGITGTTAAEAANTIQGSMGMTKAAWKNFVVGLSDPDADLGLLIDTMFDSAAATFENFLPTVERAIDGVANVIPKVAPKISQSIKNIVPKILPELLESGATLVGSLGVGILSSLPDLADAGISIMGQIRDTLNSSSFDSSGMLSNIVDDMIDRIPQVFAIGEDILAAIANNIAALDYGKLGENISKIAVSGLNSMSELIADIDWDQVGKDIADFISGIDWNGIFEAGMDALGAAIKAAPDLIEGLLDNVDFMALSATAALKFTPKLISSLGDKLKDSDFGEVENALGDKFHTAGNDSGLSFFGKFSAVVEAAIIGWNIGSVIYKAFEPEIDKAVGDIANHFSKAFGGDATIYESTDLINNWDEAFQNDAHLPAAIPELDTFQPSSLPAVADKLAQQQVLAAVANMQPTIAETAKGKISKLRNSFKLRAGGGMVRSPEFSLVGEAGTEAIIPLRNDADGIQQIADRLNKNMGGSMSVYQTFNVNANISSDNDLRDLADKLVGYMNEGLRAAQVSSDRAIGGVSW